MSNVTSVWILVPDQRHKCSEELSEEVRASVQAVGGLRLSNLPIINLMRDDWGTLQGGGKVAGTSAMWFGWNYADMDKLLGVLKADGRFSGVTVWWQNEYNEDNPPSMEMIR